MPVRRSARGRGIAAGIENVDPGAEVPHAEPESEPELEYDDSSVRRYVCKAPLVPSVPSTAMPSTAVDGMAAASVSGFRRLPGCLHDVALARAYSVDWRPGLVVAGGKDGVVSVFGSRELEGGELAADGAVPPLLSRKLHKGWISNVQLLSSPSLGSSSVGDGDAPLLLTAGNDGAVCLWDLGRAAQAGGRGDTLPQCLARACELHSGGIFSLHEQGGRVLTASKDGTVVVSSLGGGTTSLALAAVQRYDELHQGVVKCARWCDAAAPGTTFASCGNDRSLRVVDTRQPPNQGACTAFECAHATAVNCLRWHPTSPHLLLSASHDPALLLHDIRRPAQPLHRLLGHAPGARVAAIYQPSFVVGGAAVATGCERSQLLSLYCTASGATISRGDAGLTPGATFCGVRRDDPLVITASRAVFLFQPTWTRSAGSPAC